MSRTQPAATIRELTEENARLRAFTGEVMGNWPLAVSENDLHNIAVKHGVIEIGQDEDGETFTITVPVPTIEQSGE